MPRPRGDAVIVECCSPRSFALPALEPELAYVPERQTRTALVLGIRVEIPLHPAPYSPFKGVRS